MLPVDDLREIERPRNKEDGERFFLGFLVILDLLMMLAESDKSKSESVAAKVDGVVGATDAAAAGVDVVVDESAVGRGVVAVAGVEEAESWVVSLRFEPARRALESMASMVNGEDIADPEGRSLTSGEYGGRR